MAIENRTLESGTRLLARYKKQDYACTVKLVVEGQDPLKKVYILEHDGSEHSSLSAAGSQVMGGTACNGWRFWSLEGDLKEHRTASTQATPTEPKVKGKAVRKAKMLKPLKSQEGAAEGQTRWFCSGCRQPFDAVTGETPTVCPQGHSDQTAA